MNPARLMTVPCRVVARTPAGDDPYGGPVDTEEAVDARCWFSSPSTEERDGQVLTSLVLYFAPDVDLTSAHRVEVDGVGTFEVDGDPIAHRSPRTGVPTHQTVRGRAGA